jgi:TP901-1 family phage major tail protein
MAATVTVKGVDILLYANTGTDSEPSWTVVGGQQNATLSEERETIETSNKGSDGEAREFESGFFEWKIEADGIYVPNDTAYLAIKNAIRNGTKMKVRIKEDSTYTQEGYVLVTSRELDAPWDDATTYSIELQGTGPITDNPTDEE